MDRDLVYAWQVFGAGRRDFGFSGADLERFVRLSLDVLLDRGGVPFRSRRRPDGTWEDQPVWKPGITRDEIAEGIVREWREQAGETDNLDGLAFATEGHLSRLAGRGQADT